MDIVTQDQINIYSARRLLIESDGPTWLYGTAVEHNILYQYQLSGAKNIFMGVIQTESPYFQVSPVAPAPFKSTIGLFPSSYTSSVWSKFEAFCAQTRMDIFSVALPDLLPCCIH